MGKYVPPSFKIHGFNCPHCEAYSHQKWYASHIRDSGFHEISDVWFGICSKCNKYSIWLTRDILYPIASIAPMPVEDMPADVKADFIEARNISNNSPRASCALLRLAVQKLLIHLGEKGKKLNDIIGNLVKKGLPEKIQKALDSVRVIGNNAVHPGQMDLKDNTETAIALFELVNMIVDVMITQPKKIDNIYDSIPQTAKEAIEKRDN
jgi:hypothetical protein